MAELEQVERLREHANVSYAEAKEALDSCGGDILDALIYLENQGKVMAPSGGGFYTSAADTSKQKTQSDSGTEKKNETFWEMLKRFGRFCLNLINKGNNNFLDATKNGEPVFSCPVTAMIVLLIFFCYITLPLLIISLFLGFRYRFRGAELGKESVNRVMDEAAEVVEDVKKSFGGTESGE